MAIAGKAMTIDGVYVFIPLEQMNMNRFYACRQAGPDPNLAGWWICDRLDKTPPIGPFATYFGAKEHVPVS